MREIWQVSHGPENWRKVAVPKLLGYGWALYIVAGLLNNASMRTYFRADTLDDIALSSQFEIAAALCGIPLNLVFIAIVRRITQAQAGWADRLTQQWPGNEAETSPQ